METRPFQQGHASVDNLAATGDGGRYAFYFPSCSIGTL
jgi:hypothetical protein